MISLLRTWGCDEDIDMPCVLDRVQATRNSGVRFLCAQCRLRSHHYAKHSIPREPQNPRTRHLATRALDSCGDVDDESDIAIALPFVYSTSTVSNIALSLIPAELNLILNWRKLSCSKFQLIFVLSEIDHIYDLNLFN